MKFNLKKSIVLFMFFISVSIFSCFKLSAEEIVIYHTNDTHGYLIGNDKNTIGIEKTAYLKKNTPNSLLIDAGDFSQGMPIASITKGKDIIKLMNTAGYDLAVLGNHEFDFGMEQLISNVKNADFPILSSNTYKNGSLLLNNIQKDTKGCHTIIKMNGLKIGFFGLTTTQTSTSANPEGIKNIEFKNEIESAKKEIDELTNEKADVIVAICHIGNGDAPITSEMLAENMTGKYQNKIAAIIDGHSHTIENKKVNNILIVQTGSNMNNIGKLIINHNDKKTTAEGILFNVSDLKNIDFDKKTSEELKKVISSQEKIWKEKIGTVNTTLWSGWIGNIPPARFTETNFGDFSADAIKHSAEEYLKIKNIDLPVIAFENGGGIRESLPRGNISKGNLMAAFPFSNTIYLKKITPKILYEVMENSGSMTDGQDTETGMLLQKKASGGFLQISGFTVVFNPNLKKNKITSITLDSFETPLNPDDNKTEIIAAGNNFIMSGGDNYNILADVPKFAEIGGEFEIIEKFFKISSENKLLKKYSVPQKRIIMNGGYHPKNYTAFIKITDDKNNPLPNKKISYEIDGEISKTGTTDENGLLRIYVSDGAHSISLSNNKNEIYIDNYSGIGIKEDETLKFPVFIWKE